MVQKTEDSQSSQLKNMGHKLMLSIKMKKKKPYYAILVMF